MPRKSALGQFYLQREAALHADFGFLRKPIDLPALYAAYRKSLRDPSFLKIVDDYLAKQT